MKARRNRVGSFLCFSKPDTMEDEREVSPESVRRRRSINGRIFSKLFRSVSANPKPTDENAKSAKDSNRPSLRQILRSISNPSIQRGKLKKNPPGSLTRTEFGDESFVKSSRGENVNYSSSSCSSSSRLSLPASSDSCMPTQRTSLPPSGKGNYGYATGFCFVLMSLLVMIFCGRACAILWTATWLCFVPPRRSLEFAATAGKLRDVKEEKKRVVLEGFLQRTVKG